MWGLSSSPGAGIPDHVARIYWNRALVDTAGWELNDPQDLIASGLPASAPDTLEIEIPVLVDPGPFPARADISYLAWFELGYQRRLAAENDTLQFAAPDSVPPGRAQYAITAVGDSAAAWFLDRTDPENPVRLVNGTWSGSAPSLALTVEDSVGTAARHRYTLVSTARAPRPASIALFAPLSSAHAAPDLLDSVNGADYVIVSPPAFVAQAETLAAYRSAFLNGVPSPRVRIATTDRIFAQFGSGRPSPVAIRNFVQYAFRHWTGPAPSYLCLLGDATFDPKNYIGFGAPDLVPTYSRYFDPNVGGGHQYLSDDFFGFLDGPGDILLDLVVGRLPAGNASQASTLVSGKTRVYEENREFDIWRARALLCADDANVRDRPDGLGNQHVSQMERKDRNFIPKPIERQKIYLNDYAFADTTRQSKPAAREEFIVQVNRGAWLTDYIGHGSEEVLADEQLFRSSDASRLTNATRPTILGTFSCTVGKFDEPGSEGLGEMLLELPQAGTAASLAATDDTFGSASTRMNDDFMKYQFPLAPRVDSLRTSGLAFALGKNENANTSEFSTRKYVFLGDPGIVPPMPRGRGVWDKAPLDSLLRGDLAVLRGHALAASDTLPDTLATGLADVLIQGPPIRRSQASAFGSVFDYFVPGYTLFRGQVPVERGSFEVRFVVPTDARIRGRGGPSPRAPLRGWRGGRRARRRLDSNRGRGSVASRRRVSVGPPPVSLGRRLDAPPGRPSHDRDRGLERHRSHANRQRAQHLRHRGRPGDPVRADRAVRLRQRELHDRNGRLRDSRCRRRPPPARDPRIGHVPEHRRPEFHRGRGALGERGGRARHGPGLQLPESLPAGDLLARAAEPIRPAPDQDPHGRGPQGPGNRSGREGRGNYIPWDGRDSVGENVAIGVYLFHVTAESPSGGRVTAVGRALRTE
jgi:hypothetical protein